MKWLQHGTSSLQNSPDDGAAVCQGDSSDVEVIAEVVALAELVKRQYPGMTSMQRERVEEQMERLHSLLIFEPTKAPWYCVGCDRWHTRGVLVCECGWRCDE